MEIWFDLLAPASTTFIAMGATPVFFFRDHEAGHKGVNQSNQIRATRADMEIWFDLGSERGYGLFLKSSLKKLSLDRVQYFLYKY